MIYPNIDPVALELGPLKVHWYGLMYLVAFACGWYCANLRKKTFDFSRDDIDDLVFYIVLGVILGGRVGYILFYNFSQFLDNPLVLFKIWEGGMSFHGGLIGVCLSLWFIAKKHQLTFFQMSDFVAPFFPIGLGAGRIGNFINGELWGKPSDVSWAMVFPTGGPMARHPSQLYEAFFEGLILFVILWIYSSKPRPVRAVSGLFLVGYGVFRFGVEFVRVPDQHLGYLALNWLTMGQILCLPMLLLGGYLMVSAYVSQKKS
ncbi:MAG: prolipoprotein diacylglyceryl transferase [Methylococcales bacterium]|jgi:phosphatidylglycerol---prolipoprotein diacylglyceryl transferase|nr:prolipoprotein diacylglyceryl transferase [Methylococcales bacterium]